MHLIYSENSFTYSEHPSLSKNTSSFHLEDFLSSGSLLIQSEDSLQLLKIFFLLIKEFLMCQKIPFASLEHSWFQPEHKPKQQTKRINAPSPNQHDGIKLVTQEPKVQLLSQQANYLLTNPRGSMLLFSLLIPCKVSQCLFKKIYYDLVLIYRF